MIASYLIDAAQYIKPVLFFVLVLAFAWAVKPQ